MKKDITINGGIPQFGIIVTNNDAWVSSRFLAEIFGKEHFHVLRDIDNIKENVAIQFWIANFKKKTYKNRGKSYPEYLLNRKSFTLLAMGFTGEKALEFKVAYIEAFESMASHISTRILSKAGYSEMTSAIKQYVLNANSTTYAQEANMVNKIILGMSAKNFRAINNVDGSTRDNVTQRKLINLDKAQILNANLIKASLSFHERERIIFTAFKGV